MVFFLGDGLWHCFTHIIWYGFEVMEPMDSERLLKASSKYAPQNAQNAFHLVGGLEHSEHF